MQERIIELIKKTVGEMGISEQEMPVFTLEHPDEVSHGDFATNVALILAKQLKKSPVEVARQIAEKLNSEIKSQSGNKDVGVEKIEVAGPGFINFYLSPNYFNKEISEILNRQENYGQNNILNREKTIIEYTDPNPFKDFHIGHLMSNAIGESISRLVEANGAEVIRACYQGDVGLHVAKTIWGVKKMLLDSPASRKEFFGGLFGFGKNPKIWGRAYALGATNYEENEEAKKGITDLNKKVYLRIDTVVNKIYDMGRKVSLQAFEKIYKTLGTKFNEYFFESQTTKFGTDLVLENINNGVFEKSDGAVIFKGEKYGLHTRVFINSEGLPTYEAKDLGLAKLKHDRVPYEKSIIITAQEQADYFIVLLKALALIYPDLAKKTLHLPHGMLRLPSGKMSSRTGQVITGESLLVEIKEKVLEKMKDRPMSEKGKGAAAEVVAVGALKYSILKQQSGSDIIFDFDKSLSFEGDSGPYLQYSYVRAKSILEKAGKEGIKADINLENNLGNTPLSKMLIRFPEIVVRAGKEFAPHYLATYLTELASTFSTFYANEVVVDKNNPNSPYKVALTEAFSIVMKNGLKLLGIKVPEKM
jgi:arginyl-tRNA synthetase